MNKSMRYKVSKVSFFSIIVISFSILMLITTHSLTGKETEELHQLNESSQRYASLIDKLSSDGFDRAFLLKIFNDSRVEFLEKVLVINLINNHIKEDYSRFFSNQSVKSAKRFLDGELPFLSEVEKSFKVEKEVVVSILLIESSFGKRTGRNTIFNVFSTLSLAVQPDILNNTYLSLKKRYPHLTFKEVSERADKKSKSAYQELKHLLTIVYKEKVDVFNIKGSWAGAFGIAQFLPSSYLRYGLDGNNDQKVRLFNRYDSMVSVANYLRKNGWKKNLSDTRKRSIIRRYNNSTSYANAVLRLSKKISS